MRSLPGLPGAVVDRLGYLRCLECWGDRALGEFDSFHVLDNVEGECGQTDCDACGRQLAEARRMP